MLIMLIVARWWFEKMKLEKTKLICGAESEDRCEYKWNIKDNNDKLCSSSVLACEENNYIIYTNAL